MPHVLPAVFASVLATVWAASLWQGAVFAILGLALVHLMPRISASLRHILLLVLFALAAALPWLALRKPATTPPASHALEISSWVAIGIAVCWALATTVRAISLGIAWQHLRSVRRNATPLALDLPELDHATRRPVLCTSPDVDSPLIVGFFKPVLLLPEWLAPPLTPEELRQIALHECEHLRRRDDWTNLLLQIGLTLFPLNPALLWLNRDIGVQRELACDAAVVAVTARPVAYAASLARVAEQHLQRSSIRLALAAWGRQSELTQRVHALLKQPRAWTARQRTIAMTGISAVLLACATGLARAPRLLTVEQPATLASAAELATAPALPVATHKTPTVPFQLVSASFTSTTVTHTPKPTAKSVKAQHPPARQQPKLAPSYRLASVQVDALPTPHIVRTTTADQQPLAVEDLDAPVRVVPAVFSPTYLAVPVPNGWIVIQL